MKNMKNMKKWLALLASVFIAGFSGFSYAQDPDYIGSATGEEIDRLAFDGNPIGFAYPGKALVTSDSNTLSGLDMFDVELLLVGGINLADSYLKGVNIQGATYDADTRSWGGLLQGNAIEYYVRNPTSGTWEYDVNAAKSVYNIPIVGGFATVNPANGQYQKLDVNENVTISFENSVVGLVDLVYLWIRNSGFNIAWNAANVTRDSALTLSGLSSNTIIASLKYESTPFQNTWWEKLLFPFTIGAGVGGSGSGLIASGGTITESGDYRYHTFNSSGSFIISSPSTSAVEFIVVGGGGGGGANGMDSGGGGGGQFRSESVVNQAAGTYSVTVGGGGGPGAVGGSSSVFGYTAVGGGNGSSVSLGAGGNGASGGGGGGASGGQVPKGAGGIASAGHNGGAGHYHAGGGGGGAGSAGANAASKAGGNGGAGISWGWISTYVYCAGGGGAGDGDGNRNGGIGGDGAGSGSIDRDSFARSASSASNYGAGGGGNGGSGGGGRVIIRYKIR